MPRLHQMGTRKSSLDSSRTTTVMLRSTDSFRLFAPFANISLSSEVPHYVRSVRDGFVALVALTPVSRVRWPYAWSAWGCTIANEEACTRGITSLCVLLYSCGSCGRDLCELCVGSHDCEAFSRGSQAPAFCGVDQCWGCEPDLLGRAKCAISQPTSIAKSVPWPSVMIA